MMIRKFYDTDTFDSGGSTEPMLNVAVALEPTLRLRVNLYRDRNGRIEQMWMCRFTGVKEWRPLPVVCEPNDTANVH